MNAQSISYPQPAPPDMWRALIAFTVGVAGACSFGARFILPLVGYDGLRLSLVSLYLVMFWGMLTWFAWTWVARGLPSQRRGRLGLAPGLLASLCAGFAIVAVWPIRPPTLNVPVYRQVTITATGDRNASASGSEVWVLGLPGGLPTADIQRSVTTTGSWEQRAEGLISYQDQPATLQWEGWAAQHDAITFLTHPWSGIITIDIDGSQQTLDLYAPVSGSRQIALAPQSGSPAWLNLIFTLTDTVCVVALMLVATAVISRVSRPAMPEQGHFRRNWLLFTSVCASIWLLYLGAFWPGMFSNDSITQWMEVLSGRFYDAHPAFHTGLNWLVTRLWLSPATIVAAQILGLATAIGWGLAICVEQGARFRVVLIASVICGITPINGLLVVTLWKDVLYTAAFVAFSLAALRVAHSSGEWLRHPPHAVAFVVLGLGVALIRHNGISAAFVTPLILVFFTPKPIWPRLVVACGLIIGLWALIRGPVYSWMGVLILQDSRYTLAPFMSQLAQQVNDDVLLTAEEKAYVDSIRSTDTQWPFSCYDISSLFYTDALNWHAATDDPTRLMVLVGELALRNPEAAIEERVCRWSVFWEINQPGQGPMYYVPIALDEAGEWTIVHQDWVWTTWQTDYPEYPIPLAGSFFPGAARLVSHFYLQQMAGWQTLLWRPAFYSYLFIVIAGVWAWRQRSFRTLALLVPMALHIALLMGLIAAQDPRYMYPAVAMAFALWPMLLVKPQSRSMTENTMNT